MEIKSNFAVLPYYGSKASSTYAGAVLPLLPAGDITGVVDMFIGGGGIMASVATGLGKIRKIGIDYDKSVIAFHSAVQSHPERVMEEAKKIQYSEDDYNKCLKKIDDYRGGIDFNEAEIAAAVYCSVCMSRNGMRIKSYRRLEPNVKYKKDMRVYERKQKELDAIKQKMYDRLPYVISDMHSVLKDVELINDSSLNHLYLLENRKYLCVADVPYLYIKRGIKDERKSAGYLDDWQNRDHAIFLDMIGRIQKSGKLQANMWICSNFEVEDGIISKEQLMADPYVQTLLPLGWRLVIVQNKYSSSIVSDMVESKKKKKKVEVLFMNYRSIVGSWIDYDYYDYVDLFEKE